MIRYVFPHDPIPLKNADLARLNAQKIGEAIDALAERQGGAFEPDDVVKEARNRHSVLHPHFEWDRDRAAEAHWRDQARALIRLVRIEVKPDQEGTRAFVNIVDRDGHRYRRLSDVAEDYDLSNLLLQQAEKDLAAFERRYHQFLDVCADVARARKKLKEKLAEKKKKRRGDGEGDAAPAGA